MAPPKLINDEILRRLWAEGVPSADIAEGFGVDYTSVNARARAIGLPSRKGTPAAALRERGTFPPRQPRHTIKAAPQRTLARGYAHVVAIAEREGCTLAQALQRFHRGRA